MTSKVQYKREVRVAEASLTRFEIFYPLGSSKKSVGARLVSLIKKRSIQVSSLLLFSVAVCSSLIVSNISGVAVVPTDQIPSSLEQTVGKETWLKLVIARDRNLVSSQINYLSKIIANTSKKANAWSLANMIISESGDHGIDPFLVAAIVKTESLFKPHVVSSKNARGLMQVQPLTANFVRRNLGYSEGLSKSDFDPVTNLRLGIRYFKYLQALFKGRTDLALMAYNWGPAKVERALRAGRLAPRSVRKYSEQIIADGQKWNAGFTKSID